MKKIFKILSKFQDIFAVIIIISLGIFLSYKNYTPDTWLTGWDNLHPEFNLLLNIKRSAFAVWQEYQGLGLLGGMAHASDLPRQLILLLFSKIFPLSFLRYLWTFLMLIAGPVGVYFLIKKVLFRANDSFISVLASLAGGLYYLNNLATIQYFYTPYESFVNFYGFFPWLLYLGLNFLNHGGRKNALIFFAVSLLSAPSFYVQTLFVVYIACLSLFLLEYFLRHKAMSVRRIFALIAIVVCTNFYWLAPASYFSISNTSVTTESKINGFSNPEIKLFNDTTGNIGDSLMLKGFWFEYSDLQDENSKHQFLMPDWREHAGKKEVKLLYYFLFSASVGGFILMFFKKGMEYKIASFTVLLLSLFMLFGDNPPLGFAYDLIADNIKIFDQMFRSAFTKWSIPAALSYSIGISFLIFFMGTLIKKNIGILIALFFSFLIIAGTTYSILPASKGNLFYSNLKIKIPQEYFDLFDFFDSQPEDARIAFFPIQTFWGWNFYDWGYRGSGFLWYGIKQPILDRAFDVWSLNDEDFYHQESDALYGNDPQRFKQTLDKYDVAYLLVDENVYFYGVDKKYLRFEEVKEFFADSEPVFSNNKLSVYKINDSGFLKTADDLPKVDDKGNSERRDVAYADYGNYIQDKNNDIFYPFSELLKDKQQNIGYSDEKENSGWIKINAQVENAGDNFDLVIPPLEKGIEIAVPARLELRGKDFYVYFLPNTKINSVSYSFPDLPDLLLKTPRYVSRIYASVGKDVFELSQDEQKEVLLRLVVGEPIDINLYDLNKRQEFVFEPEFLDANVSKCWNREGYEGVMNASVNQDEYLSISIKDAAGCFAFKVGQIDSYKTGLMEVNLPYRSENGSRPHFCIVAEDPVYKCENDDIFYNTYPSPDEWGVVNRKIVLDSSKKYWMEVAAKPADEKNIEWSIDYGKPEIYAYPMFSYFSFDGSVWEPLLAEKRMRVFNDGETFDFEMYVKKEIIDLVLGGRINVKNCDVFERGNVKRDIDRETGKVSYTSEEYASACDYVPMNTFSNKISYILRFLGEGVQGRGSKFYLYNKASGRNDLEMLLGLKAYDKSYSVLSWPEITDDSYVLNIENRSFGGLAEDRIDSIYSYQVPLDWLSKWRLEKPLDDGNIRNVEFNQDFENVNYKKTGTYRYDLEVDGSEGVIALAQGYEGGWTAYEIGCQVSDVRCWIKQKIPFIFGKKLEHAKYNGWGNAWLLKQPRVNSGQWRVDGEGETNTVNSEQWEEETDKDIDKDKEAFSGRRSTVVILYLPQYLQFVGYGLLAVGVITIFCKSKGKSKWGEGVMK